MIGNSYSHDTPMLIPQRQAARQRGTKRQRSRPDRIFPLGMHHHQYWRQQQDGVQACIRRQRQYRPCPDRRHGSILACKTQSKEDEGVVDISRRTGQRGEDYIWVEEVSAREPFGAYTLSPTSESHSPNVGSEEMEEFCRASLYIQCRCMPRRLSFGIRPRLLYPLERIRSYHVRHRPYEPFWRYYPE